MGGRGSWRRRHFYSPSEKIFLQKKTKEKERRGSRAGFAAYPNAIAFSKTLSSSLTNVLFRASGVRSPIPARGTRTRCRTDLDGHQGRLAAVDVAQVPDRYVVGRRQHATCTRHRPRQSSGRPCSWARRPRGSRGPRTSENRRYTRGAPPKRRKRTDALLIPSLVAPGTPADAGDGASDARGLSANLSRTRCVSGSRPRGRDTAPTAPLTAAMRRAIMTHFSLFPRFSSLQKISRVHKV